MGVQIYSHSDITWFEKYAFSEETFVGVGLHLRLQHGVGRYVLYKCHDNTSKGFALLTDFMLNYERFFYICFTLYVTYEAA